MHARRRFALALLLALTLCLPVLGQKGAKVKAGAKPPTSAKGPHSFREYTIEQLMNNERITGASFSADDKRVTFSSNRTGIFNVLSAPIAGGKPEQLTSSATESVYVVSDFPNDSRLLYSHDQGGNENSHIYLRTADGKERDLTPGEKNKAEFTGWSEDGKAFYYTSNQRDPKFFDLYRMDASALTPELVFQNEKGFDIANVSADGKWVALNKTDTEANSDIWLYSVAMKELKLLTQHEGDIVFEATAFDPRTGYLYFLSDEGGEFRHLGRFNVATGKREMVQKAGWDIQFAYFSRHGKYRVVGINEDGATKIHIYDAKGRELALPKFPQGEIRGVTPSPSEKQMAFYFVGDTSPANLYVYDFGTKKLTRVTHSLNPDIDAANLVEGKVVRYKSFDGMMIPAILYAPQQSAGMSVSAANKSPGIVQVHGGPGGQSRKGYSALIQFLVNHGYTVLMVNNRGSSGYGKTFYAADDHKHGKEPLWDCIEGKHYLQSLAYVDKEKIAILGGSYGGYMVLAALAFKPEEFRAGVDIFGVANWVRTLNSIPPYWESFRKALYKEIGDPTKEEAYLKEISPVFHADQIRRPLIVLQGANDPRVIQPESDDIVAAVKKNGVPVEYIIFPNEGHGFTKKANEIKGYQAVLEFLDKYVKNAPPDAPAASK
ncbi:MAG: S9 family peptidase [Acidobacteriota bacterium]|nr:S9 family peptidase [Acidobacteriota bacterium]